MNSIHTRRHPVRKKSKRLLVLLFIVIFLFSAAVSAFLWNYFAPNRQHVDPDYHNLQKPVFYQGAFFPTSAIGEKEELKLPLDLIQQWLDPTIVYEQSSDSVIITTKDKVLRLKTSQLSAFMNEKPFTLKFPVDKKDEKVYVPIEPLLELYPIELRESEESGAVILVKQGDLLKWGKSSAKDISAMRSGPSIKSPIVSEVVSNEEVIIWGEESAWYKIQQKSGPVGYIQKTKIVLDHDETIPQASQATEYIPWKPLGGKLNVTWEHIISKNPDVSKIPDMPGLNVISPTWFSLEDGEGNVKNLANAAYAKWAHSRDLQVWALFSNGFEPDRTSVALSTYDRRITIIKKLLAYAKTYNLQGFNIDFENVYLKDKENLVQFVREMTPLMHEQGLVVSMDVTPKSTNEMWSMFYDRPALAEVVDYMMVMAYDEHWATSPKSGSVSSLPWAEQAVVQLLEQEKVPNSKLVLGIPYYTRLWTEVTKDGKTSVSSKALSMGDAQAIIEDKQLTPVFSKETGQNYVEYKENDKLMRIWLEDETSVKSRIDLVKKYDLAGVASWRRGFEDQTIWKAIQETMEKRP